MPSTALTAPPARGHEKAPVGFPTGAVGGALSRAYR
nr:MAG TPA: hypothetical protein [Caudoviricetes sp.]